jgi:hypothetical protein
MSESKHTPGPWSFEDDRNDSRFHAADDGCHVIIGESGLTEALVFGDENEDVLVANARLIAAAPTMLEACEVILARARRHTDGTARMDAEDLRDLRDAVKAAKGA